MKVSGDNPVFVQSVKRFGAAEKAGLHSGDIIIKVNGLNVTHSTHTEVVELIKCKFTFIIYLFTQFVFYYNSCFCHIISASTQVELSVQQRPLFINSSNPNLTSPLPVPTMNSTNVPTVTSSNSITPSRPLHHHHSAPARDRITGPQPVDVCIIIN